MAQDQGSTAQAAQLSEQLLQVSRKLDAGISQLRELHSQIKGQWYGPASEAYCSVLDQLILQMQGTCGKLIEVSDSLKSAQTKEEST